MNSRTWTVAYLPDLKIIESRFNGFVSPGDLRLVYQRIGALAARHGCFRVLTDCTAVTYGFDIGDLTGTIGQLDLDEQQGAYREAIILPYSHVAQHSLKLWELACQSKDLAVQCFVDVETAMAWLV